MRSGRCLRRRGRAREQRGHVREHRGLNLRRWSTPYAAEAVDDAHDVDGITSAPVHLRRHLAARRGRASQKTGARFREAGDGIAGAPLTGIRGHQRWRRHVSLFFLLKAAPSSPIGRPFGSLSDRSRPRNRRAFMTHVRPTGHWRPGGPADLRAFVALGHPYHVKRRSKKVVGGPEPTPGGRGAGRSPAWRGVPGPRWPRGRSTGGRSMWRGGLADVRGPRTLFGYGEGRSVPRTAVLGLGGGLADGRRGRRRAGGTVLHWSRSRTSGWRDHAGP